MTDANSIPETEQFFKFVVARKGGGKGGSDGGNTSSHVSVEAPNTLRSKATARIMEILSEGPIDGLVTGDMQSVFLDKTPVLNPDLSANFNVTQASFRNGDADQDVVPGFSASEAEVSVGTAMVYNVGLVRRITPGIDSVRMKLRVNGLYTQETNGDINGSTVNVLVEVNYDSSGWDTLATITISGKTMSAYERAVLFALPKTSMTIDFRLTRTTPTAGANVTNGVVWGGYTEIVDGTLKYDDTALAAMVIDAQYFPNVPTRGYLIKGIHCQIPTNYDPIARTYTGDWDGTFVHAWTNNPAWILYETLTNPRWGVGRDIDAAAVDKWGFYECAVYNDGMVPDGYGTGGVQPRFTCNCVIATRQDAFQVLNAIASSMHALLYWSNGTVYVVQDRPSASPGRLFSPANVTGGLFDYTGADYRSRFNAVGVSWIDPTQNYEPTVDLVQDPEYMRAQPYRDTSSTAYGCTVRGQALRHGRWVIYTAQNETEAVSFRVSLENADVRPGEHILIQDPSRAGARLAGRTLDREAVTNVLILDAPVPEIAVGWKIYVVVENEVVETTVSAVISTTHFTVSGSPATVPPGSMWLAFDTSIQPTPWRVASIKEADINQYEILATQYAPEKFAYVDLGMKVPPQPYSLIPTGPLVGPTDLNYSEFIYLDPTGVPQAGIVLSWLGSTDPRVAYYKLEMVGPSDEHRNVGHVIGVSTTVFATRAGAWTAYVTAVDNLGRAAIPETLSFVTIGLSARPMPPVAVYATINGPNVELNWVPTTEIDVLFYWLQWHPATDGSALWERSTSLSPRISRSTTRATVPARVGTYFIKTIDALGQESATAVSTVLYNTVLSTNSIDALIEQPAWGGTLGGDWYISVGDLHLPPPSVAEVVPPEIYPGLRGTILGAIPTRYAYYDFLGTFDQGAIGEVTLTAIIDAYGAIGDDSMSTWVPLASAVPLAMGSSNQWDVSIEVRFSDDGSTWGEWAPLKAAVAQTRAIQARLVGLIYDLQTELRLTRAELIIETPNRQARGTATIDGSGNASVTYTPGFFSTPDVQFTGFSTAAVGTSLVIMTSNQYGFTARQRNASGTAVGGGSFNWLASGFGVS